MRILHPNLPDVNVNILLSIKQKNMWQFIEIPER